MDFAPRLSNRGYQRLAAACAALLLSLAAAAQDSCPPVAQMPTPEQVRAAQREARDRGMLWRISKDGRDSYLYGTLHVGKLAWAMPGPKLREAIAATDTLALEVDLTDPGLLKSMADAGTAKAESALKLPDALVQRLAKQRDAACLPDGALAALHPVMQAVTLSVLAARWEGLDAGFGQELVLGGAARAMRRTIVSLESVGLQMAVLMPERPDAALNAIDKTLQQLEQDRVRPVIRRLAQVWEQGSLAELEDYPAWCDCMGSDDERQFFSRINDGRNPAMAERIDELHSQGKRVLAAVGALHMTGTKGLPKLLAQRGYAVERIGFAPM
jgi:uncharacterized protein